MENQTEEIDPLQGWTKEDKYNLLLVLKASGSHNISEFCACLPDKSTEEIIEGLQYYKRRALKHPTIVERSIAEAKSRANPQIPLASWAKLLTDNISYKNLQNEVATALRLIAEFERRPGTVCTEEFDFKKIYHMLANAVEGKPLQQDKLTVIALDKCLMETALLTKPFIHTSALRYILDDIDLSDKNMHHLIAPTDNHELRVVRQLASQRNYNPLRIPDEYFTCTKPDD